MEQFSDFAYLYDELNVNYDKQKIIKRMKQLLCGCREVVDLCCGTGDVAIALAKNGFRITGIDVSSDMLNVANEKAMKNASRVMLLCENAQNFKLMNKVDAVYSLTDGMNYMIGKDELEKTFRSVNNALKNNGLFIFDISTQYKYENILANNVFTFDFDDAFLCWQNDYDKSTRICTMSITGFNKNGKNTYTRFDEIHKQYSYTINDIEQSLENTGFVIDNIYSGYDDIDYQINSERILVKAQKRR